MNYGFPATKSSGFSKAVPVYSAFKAPYGKYGKPFGYGKFNKTPFFGFGYPATKGSGFNSKVPVTSVATSPFPGI